MADKKISELPAFTDLDLNDLIPVVDISEASSALRTKAYKVSDLTSKIAEPTSKVIYVGSYITANRPTLGSSVRAIGYNDTLHTFEGWNGTLWTGVGGGATGGGNNQAFYENDITVTTDYTISSGRNAMSAGPITIADGVTVTIPTGSVWTVV